MAARQVEVDFRDIGVITDEVTDAGVFFTNYKHGEFYSIGKTLVLVTKEAQMCIDTALESQQRLRCFATIRL